jgi:hypothetical protein
MTYRIPFFAFLLCSSGLLQANPPEPLCANVALSFINQTTAGNRVLQSEGCLNTADGLAYEASSTETLSGGGVLTYLWRATVSDNPAACQTGDTCCIAYQEIDPGLPGYTTVELYANNGQYRRDLREMRDVCAALISP